MNQSHSEETIHNELFKMLTCVILLNMAMVILQRINMKLGLQLIQALQNEASYTFALDNTKWGSFGRCFGALSYPMQLGIFCLFAHTFLSFEETAKARKLRPLLIILNLICGVFSASKTYVIGMAILLVLQIITQAYFKRISYKLLGIIGSLMVVVFLCVIFYDQIYIFLDNFFGAEFAYYWKFLGNIAGIFRTRYSSSAEFLSYMPEFLNTYWLMGAGPVSLVDEGVLDSAVYVILHSGGIVALLIILIYYGIWVSNSILQRDMLTFMLLIVILMTGSGFQTWIVSDASTWVLMYMFMQYESNQDGETIESGGHRASD